MVDRPRVAVTRSADDNRALAAALEQRGVEAVPVPLVEVVGPADGGRALGEALANLDRYRWLVLTSANAVRAVRAVTDRGLDRDGVPAGLAVAAVGPVTAAEASRAGWPVTLVPAAATAEALVAAFPSADGADHAVLAPLAELADRTVEDGLRAKGWVVDRVEAYRTEAPSPVLVGDDPGPLDAVAFFSPSAVDRWIDRFGSVPAVVVCIGPSTARRARERGIERPAVAEPHTTAAVVEAVAALVTGRREDPPTLAP